MEIKNLERIHREARPSVEYYAKRLILELGDSLRSICVYGSATGPDYIPNTSNINIVAVLESISGIVLKRILGTVRWGMKKRVVPPLLLTPDYIQTSLDTFPIEFMEIKDTYVVLAGDDFFSQIEVEPEHVQLECESQLKATLLRTRQAYLEIGWQKKGAERVLHTSLTSLVPVFRAMLGLKGLERPRKKEEVIKSLGSAFEIDTSTFLAILRDKAGDEKIGSEEAHQVLERYIDQLSILARKVDEL